MPEISGPSGKKFDSLYFWVRKARTLNERELKAATASGDTALRDNLLLKRLELKAQLYHIIDLEIDFLGSNTNPSTAENGLAIAVTETRRLVGRLNSIARILNAAAEIASILARFASLL